MKQLFKHVSLATSFNGFFKIVKDLGKHCMALDKKDNG